MNTLDEIIEAVADVLLIFQEAQSDFFNDIVIKKENLDIMVSEVTKMMADRAKDSASIEDLELKQRFIDANKDIAQSLRDLQELVKTAGGEVIPRRMYEALHQKLEVILRSMIFQLQVADQVNCNILLRGCKKAMDSLIRLINVQVPEGINIVAPIYRKYMQDLEKDANTRLAELTKPELRSKLETAMEHCRNSYSILPEKCLNALTNSSTKQERDKAVEIVVKAIEEMVVVVEESNRYIREYLLQFGLPPETAKRIERVHPNLEEELERLEEAVKNRDVPTATQAARAFASASAEQVENAKALAARSQDPYWRNALLNDSSKLSALTPQIVEATKYSLQNVGDREAPKRLHALVEDAKAIARRLDNDNKSEKEGLEKKKALNRALDALERTAKSGNVGATEKALEDALKNLHDQINYGKAAYNEAQNPRYKAQIESAVQKLERLEPLIAQAARNVAQNPNDREAAKRLEALNAEAKKAAADIAKAVLEDKLYTNKKALQAVMEDLQDAAARGDKGEVERQLNDLRDFVKRRVELGRELADQVDDPAIKKQILDACNELERLLPLIEDAARYAAAHPEDAEAQKRLADLLDQMRNAAARITAEKLFPSVDPNNATKGALLDSTKDLGEDLEHLRELINEGDYKGAEELAQDISQKAKRQVQLARMVAAKMDDPKLKQALLDAAKDLEAIFAKLGGITAKTLTDPKGRKEALELIDQAQKVNDKMADITLAKDSKPKGNLNQPEYSEIRPDGSKDNVMVAAHDVTRAVNEVKKKAREAPAIVLQQQNNLLDVAAQIGKEMELLSLAAQKGNKTEMIACSRRIAEMIHQVQKFSEEIGNKCKDPRLKSHLLNCSRVPKNFSVQLKIIAGVKSRTDDDPSAEAQLVTCAQQLANSVIATVEAAHSAAVKCK